MPEGLRLSVGLLTVLPVGRRGPVADRRTAGRAMLWAPVVGVLLGLLGAATMAGSRAVGQPRLLAAALALAALAGLTRGLHLDGLADTADALGSRRPGPAALEVMRAGDVGPFGVVTLVLVLLVQATAASAAGPAALLVAVVTGRVAITAACRRGVPAARPDGLGALVASTVRPVHALVVVALAVLGSAALGWRGPVAVLAALAAAEGLRRHVGRRLGGITGDVLGAVTEVATTVCLVVLA